MFRTGGLYLFNCMYVFVCIWVFVYIHVYIGFLACLLLPVNVYEHLCYTFVSYN